MGDAPAESFQKPTHWSRPVTKAMLADAILAQIKDDDRPCSTVARADDLAKRTGLSWREAAKIIDSPEYHDLVTDDLRTRCGRAIRKGLPSLDKIAEKGSTEEKKRARRLAVQARKALSG